MKKKTNAELRVEIARDVIGHVEANELVVRIQTYFHISEHLDRKYAQLQERLSEVKNCTVCALGGLFYSNIVRNNNFRDGSCIDSYSMRKSLSMFSKKQLMLIESAFEMGDFFEDFNTYCSVELLDRAILYRERNNLGDGHDKTGFYDDSGKALIHIMNNIIKNKGTFKP